MTDITILEARLGAALSGIGVASAVIDESVGTPEELELLRKLAEENTYWIYCGMITDQPGEYFVVNRFMFTGGLLRGSVYNQYYDDRWCYDTTTHAIEGVIEWRARGFDSEPEGWHRHVATGRRRPKGDKSKEYVCP